MSSIRRLAARFLCASLAAISWAAFAQHRDPAPLPDEVAQRIVAMSHAPRTASFTHGLRRRLDALTVVAGEATDSARRRHLVGQRGEFATLRAQARAELATTRSRIATLSQPERVREHDEFVTKVEERFNRVEHHQTETDDDDDDRRREAVRRLQGELRTLHGEVLGAELRPAAPVPAFKHYEPLPSPVQPASQSLPQYLARKPSEPIRYAALGYAPPVTPPEAASCGYTAADLATTGDVPQSSEIQFLAASLGYSPIRIFEYVSNNIAFEPYYGALKGAQATLLAKAGGPTDQASLLIALLRASNVPARYVRGNVQMTDAFGDPTGGRISRWIGAKTVTAAVAILRMGNFAPSTSISSSGQNVLFNHVWVEACVPYGHYRGIALDNTGERWIPLDPSYKDRSYQPGLNVHPTFDYGTYLSKRSNGPTSLPEEAFVQRAESAVRSIDPNASVKDLPYTGTTKAIDLDLLPASLPFEIVNFTNWPDSNSPETANLPAAHRYAFYLGGLNLTSRYRLYMPDIALSRMTLSFKGASAADRAALDSWRSNGNLNSAIPCTTTINVVPNLMVEGVVQPLPPVSTPIALCSTSNTLTMEIGLQELAAGVTAADPNNVGRINFVSSSNIGAANWHALQAYAFQGSGALIAQRVGKLTAAVNATPNPNVSDATLDATEGEFLHLAGLKYMRYITEAGKTIGALKNDIGLGGPHLGLMSSQMKVAYVFDLPYAISRSGFLADMGGLQDRGNDLSSGLPNYGAMLLAGYASSAYEAYIWQEMVGLDAISTVRGLQFANETGVGTYTVDSFSWSRTRPVLRVHAGTTPSDCSYMGVEYPRCVIDDTNNPGSIISLINQGFTVTLPASLIQYSSDWTGIVYLAESSYANIFAIGKFAGGWSIETQVPLNLYDPVLGQGYVPTDEAPSYLAAPLLGSVDDAAPLTLNGNNGTPAVSAGDPVNMLTGNMYHTETDLSIKGRGGLPIVFERSYNSRLPQDGPLGYGWTHSFNHFLKFYGVEGGLAKVSWIDGTGAEKFFTTTSHSGGNVTTGTTLTNQSGVYTVFQRAADGTYTLRENNGLTYKFATATGPAGVPGSATTPVIARLLSITDRNGNALTLSYAATAGCAGGTLLCSVTDAIGRSLGFSYSGNRISQIQDFTGRTWQYGYTGSDLTSFKNPLAVAGTQNPVTYSYYSATDGTALPHLMKQYTLPRGNGMRFEYYPNGRTARHTVVLTDGTLSPDQVNTFRYNDFRREAVQTNERGYDRHFFFDAFGNPIRIVEESGGTHVYVYDCADPTQAAGSAGCPNPFNRLKHTGPDGYQTLYQYDAKGNVVNVTPPRGASAAVQYLDFNGFNQPRRSQDGNGRWTIQRYDANGNLTDTIKTVAGYAPPSCAAAECAIPAASQIVAWTVNGYDSAGNRTSAKRVRDFAAQIASNTPTSNTGPIAGFSFDANKLNATGVSRTGLQNGDTVPSTQTATLDYDGLGRLKNGIDADWQPTQFSYDALDRISQATDRLGNLRDYYFDDNGNPIGQKLEAPVAGVQSLVDSSSTRYDDADRKVATTDAGGFVTAYSYDPAGNVLAVTNPDAYSVGFDYEADNRPWRAYDQEGHAVSTDRDPSGRIRSVTDPNGNTVTRGYWDASRDGRLKRIIMPRIGGQAGGRTVEYDWDANGNVIRATEIPSQGSGQFDSLTTTTEFDELNRAVRIVGPAYTDNFYDAGCPVTINRYDTLGRLWQVAAGYTPFPCSTPASDVAIVQSTYTYDDFDRLVKTTDALGRSWTASYDANNNVSSATDAKGQTTKYTWATGHQLMTRVEHNGRSTAYTRNVLGQAIAVTHPEASYGYEYDAAHRLKRLTRGQKSLSYDWSPGGWLNSVTDGDGRITSYRYDPVGRLAGITAPNGDNAAFRFDGGGRLMEKILPNGVSSRYAYNEDDSLRQIVNRTAADTILSQHDYAYDGFGSRASHSEQIGDSTVNYTYQHDPFKRLTEVSNGNPDQLEYYTYDPFGNLTIRTVGQNNPVVTAYLYDAANQLSEIHSDHLAGPLQATLHYDANGNLQSDGSRTYTWDAIDQLSQVTKGPTTVTYGYDAEGRRVRKVTGGAVTQWLYDGDNLYAEYGASWTTPTAVYAFAGLDHPLSRTLVTGAASYGQASYYAQDGLGSVVGISNDTTTQTQRFDAWGNKLSGSIPQSAQFGYTGREPDETGIVYYRARYYDPGLGRFVSRDPMGLTTGTNLYSYVNGNPVNLVDPWGLAALSPDVIQALNSNRSYTGEVMTDAPGGCGVGTVCAQLAPPINPITGFGGVGAAGSKTGNQSLNGALSSSTGHPVLDEASGAGTQTNLLGKMAAEVQGITERMDLGPEGEVYSLRATKAGDYTNVRGGTTHLEAGDVYKFGETTQPATRYSDGDLRAQGLRQVTEFQGSQMMAKIVEKLRIYGHFFENGELPPGNRIFR